MGFHHESMFSASLMAAIGAVLLSFESPPDTGRVWHYYAYGFVFLALAMYFLNALLFDSDFSNNSPRPSLMIGAPLAVAAWLLHGTPYPTLAWVAAGYALAFLVIAPTALWIRNRRQRLATPAQPAPPGPPGATAVEPSADSHPLYKTGELLIVAAIAIGLVLALAYLTRHWGLVAGAIGFVVWPLTLIAVPWYAVIEQHEWLQVAVVYGGGVAGWLLKHVAQRRAAPR